MIVGVPKEVKQGEFRVALTPGGVESLRQEGVRVCIQKGAGLHAGFLDHDYRRAGAVLVDVAKAWAADLVLKVKEPQTSEFRFFRRGQTLFTFLHLAPNRPLVDALLKFRVTAIGYETVEENGKLPILEPMSEIAGRVAALMGAYYQGNPQGGGGVLFGGMPGVSPAHVVVLGGGTVGENAARVALGMGSRVTILERRAERMRYLDEILPHVETVTADPSSVREAIASADIVIGAVHIPGARTPRLITRAMVKRMKPRSVIVDVAIDQGGSCETSKATSHLKPTFIAEGVLHYGVPNMPGAFGRTSTLALTHATLSYVLALTRSGVEAAVRQSAALLKGLQCHNGHVVSAPVAEAQGRPYTPFSPALNVRSRQGFTLLELLMVVAILGILLSIGTARYRDLIKKSDEGATRGNIGSLRSALNIYYGDTHEYPRDSLASLTSDQHYMQVIPPVKIKHLHPVEINTVTPETSPTETTGWSYNNSETDLNWGRLSVGCLHNDLHGAVWSSY